MNDSFYMQRALELAERGRHSTSPNPMVGCVIVRNGEVIGEGFHLRAGLPHAEVEALRVANQPTTDATFYVSLEPCAHTGRTPPCVDAVIAARPARVVIAMTDPFAEVNGRGIEKLKAAGIEVEVGVCEDEARLLNEKFLYSVAAKRPFVLLKAGMTLDGKLATVARQSKWITSPEARERSLLLREEYDAIMVGGGTVRHDDPQLTRRLNRNSSITPWTRIVIDSDGDLPAGAKVFDGSVRTLLFTSLPERYETMPNVEIVATRSEAGALDLGAVLDALHALGIRSVIAEGGSLLHSAIIREKLWQKMILFIAPMVIGGSEAPSIFSAEGVAELTDAYRLSFHAFEKVGPDLMVTAYPT